MICGKKRSYVTGNALELGLGSKTMVG